MNTFNFEKDVFNPFFKSILWFIKTKIKSNEDAEDLAMIVMNKVAIALPKFEEKTASLKSWVFKVANNAVIDYWRKRKLETLSLDFEYDNESDKNSSMQIAYQSNDPLRELIVNETIQLVKNKITSIENEDVRNIMQLYFVEQKKYEEISQELNIPLGSVKNKVFLFKKELKEVGLC